MANRSIHSDLKKLVSEFSSKHFYQVHPDLDLRGAMLEKVNGQFQVVLMVGQSTNHDLLHSVARQYFGDCPYRISMLDENPTGSMGQVDNGAGIMRKGSSNFGTVGGWFRMETDRNGNPVDPSFIFGVSNNHVIGMCGNGAPDDELTDVNGVTMGRLFDVVHLDPNGPNDVDLAIFKVEQQLRTNWFSGTPSGWTGAQIGYGVYKQGFKTKRTTGSIAGTGDIVANLCGTNYHFRDVLAIRGDAGPFSDEGDSGSLVVTTNGLIVGLLFAKAGDFAYACRIKHLGKMNLIF